MYPSNDSGPYRGRFAPSPTGPLHFGSLVAALGSYLDARSHGGEWLVRIEDLDLPRCPAENAWCILRTLEDFGFAWEREPVWQSQRTELYRDAFAALRQARAVYPCACSRRELADSALAPDGAHVYPGTCRDGLPAGLAARTWRVRVDSGAIDFDDRSQGHWQQDLAREVGDFVLLRADSYFAYQLAVVVDDAEQGITDVVRGADLLKSTPRQILLQRLLNLPSPRYTHLPVAVNAAGEKLSKQTGAPPLDPAKPMPSLFAALNFLGQAPPAELHRATLRELWQWAMAHWDLGKVPAQRTITLSRQSGQRP